MNRRFVDSKTLNLQLSCKAETWVKIADCICARAEEIQSWKEWNPHAGTGAVTVVSHGVSLWMMWEGEDVQVIFDTVDVRTDPHSMHLTAGPVGRYRDIVNLICFSGIENVSWKYFISEIQK